ncbi:MAG TPA: L,D-transpeptidase [Pseudonocardia sp.]|nr:L,D-transpeptidase [Pseudonocardia sp.]
MLSLGGGRHGRRLACVAVVAGGLLIAHGSASAVTAKPPVHGTASHSATSHTTAKTPAAPTDTTLMIGTPCTVTARACVDLTTQKAWLFKDNAIERGPVDITSGGPGKETPTGNFTVAWKDRNHVNPELTPMPYSVFFAVGGVAFHGGSLQRQSAGCVHLDLDDAIIFYDSLAIGAPVQVRGVAPAKIATSNDDRSRPRSNRRGADLPSDGPPIQDDSSPPSSSAPPSRSSSAPAMSSRPSSSASGPSSSGPDDLLGPAGG